MIIMLTKITGFTVNKMLPGLRDLFGMPIFLCELCYKQFLKGDIISFTVIFFK